MATKNESSDADLNPVDVHASDQDSNVVPAVEAQVSEGNAPPVLPAEDMEDTDASDGDAPPTFNAFAVTLPRSPPKPKTKSKDPSPYPAPSSSSIPASGQRKKRAPPPVEVPLFVDEDSPDVPDSAVVSFESTSSSSKRQKVKSQAPPPSQPSTNCVLCQDELTFPAVMCAECFNSFCEGEIETYKEGFKHKTTPIFCPICKHSPARFVPNRTLNQMLGSRLIECTNQCGEQVAQASMDDHLKYRCSFREVNCPDAGLGCVWIGIETELATHRLDCYFAKNSEELKRKADLRKEIYDQLNEAQLKLTSLTNELLRVEETFQAMSLEKIAMFSAQLEMMATQQELSKFVKTRKGDFIPMILDFFHGSRPPKSDAELLLNTNLILMKVEVVLVEGPLPYFQLWGHFENQRQFPLLVVGYIVNLESNLPRPIQAVQMFARRFDRNGVSFLLFEEKLCYEYSGSNSKEAESDNPSGLLPESDNPFENLDVSQAASSSRSNLHNQQQPTLPELLKFGIVIHLKQF